MQFSHLLSIPLFFLIALYTIVGKKKKKNHGTQQILYMCLKFITLTILHRKSLGPHNFSQFLSTTVTRQSMIGKEKIMDPYIGDS